MSVSQSYPHDDWYDWETQWSKTHHREKNIILWNIDTSLIRLCNQSQLQVLMIDAWPLNKYDRYDCRAPASHMSTCICTTSRLPKQTIFLREIQKQWRLSFSRRRFYLRLCSCNIQDFFFPTEDRDREAWAYVGRIVRDLKDTSGSDDRREKWQSTHVSDHTWRKCMYRRIR